MIRKTMAKIEGGHIFRNTKGSEMWGSNFMKTVVITKYTICEHKSRMEGKSSFKLSG